MITSKRIITILAAASVLLLTRCSGRIEQVHVFEQNTWLKFSPVVFEIPSPAKTKPYHIRLKVNYTELFPSSDLPVVVTLRTPSGEERIIKKRIWLKSLDHQPKGEASNGHYSLDVVLWYEFVFREKGIYHLTLESDHPKYQAEGILSVEAIVQPGKLTPPKPVPGTTEYADAPGQ